MTSVYHRSTPHDLLTWAANRLVRIKGDDESSDYILAMREAARRLRHLSGEDLSPGQRVRVHFLDASCYMEGEVVCVWAPFERPVLTPELQGELRDHYTYDPVGHARVVVRCDDDTPYYVVNIMPRTSVEVVP